MKDVSRRFSCYSPGCCLCERHWYTTVMRTSVNRLREENGMQIESVYQLKKEVCMPTGLFIPTRGSFVFRPSTEDLVLRLSEEALYADSNICTNWKKLDRVPTV